MPIYNYEGWTPDYDEIERLVSKLEFRSFGQAAPDLKDDGIGEINLLYRNLVNIRGSWCYYQQEIGDCFNGSSLVQMADGSKKPIQNIREGEYVLSAKLNKKKVTATISNPFSDKMKRIYAGYSSIAATPDHKFLTSVDNYSFEQCDDLLNKPVFLFDSGLSDATVYDISEEKPERDRVYCIEVEDDHSFICDGFAVHNCVSHAFARGLMLLMATEIVHGEKEIYAGDVSSEDIYGGARVYEGRNSLGSQDGCVGVWGASYIQKYGSLLRKVYGSIDLRQYSGKRAKEWGMRGPPKELEEYSRDHTIQSYNLCDSAEEARSAIANGYPVIVCSDVGFKDYRDRSGFAIRGPNWAHAMLLVGCDDYSKRKSFIVDNTSWGPNWISGNVPEFCPDLPGGMMPVDWEIVDRMLRQGDSYSISSFNGYKKRKVQFENLLL